MERLQKQRPSLDEMINQGHVQAGYLDRLHPADEADSVAPLAERIERVSLERLLPVDPPPATAPRPTAPAQWPPGSGQVLNPAMLADLVMAQAAQARSAGQQLPEPAVLADMAMELLRASERLPPGVALPHASPPRGELPRKVTPPKAFLPASALAASPQKHEASNRVPLPARPMVPSAPGGLLAPGEVPRGAPSELPPRHVSPADAWLHAGPQVAPAGLTAPTGAITSAAASQADPAVMKPPFVLLVDSFCRRALGPEHDEVHS